MKKKSFALPTTVVLSFLNVHALIFIDSEDADPKLCRLFFVTNNLDFGFSKIRPSTRSVFN